MSVLSLLRVFGLYHQRVTILLMGLLAAYASYLIPDVLEWATSENREALFGAMSDDLPYIEGSRKFPGLLIAELALSTQFLFRKAS